MALTGLAKRAAATLAASVLVAIGLPAPPAATAASVPSAPRSAKACAVNASVTVSWRTPSTASASIDRYKVVRATPELPKASYLVGPRKRSLTIPGLRRGTTYSFKVLAHNDEGWGTPSSTVKAVPPRTGFGTVRGTCGTVVTQLDQPTPSLFENRFDFHDDPYGAEDLTLLKAGTQEIVSDGNPGESSLYSEMFAFETLARSEGASLVKTEDEIVYDQLSATTDLSVDISGNKVGVSVTRAVTAPPDTPYPVGQATALLTAKLADILESSANVTAEDAWVKQILVVVAYCEMHAASIKSAWVDIAGATKADTVLYLVVTDGSDSNVYFAE